MKVVGELSQDNLKLIREWCQKQPLELMTKSSYVKGRLEKWYRYASNLQSITGRGEVFYAGEPKDDLAYDIICAFGNVLLPGWNSLLVCGGPTSIGWHRDHGHFMGPAVMINLGEALYSELPRHSDIKQANLLTSKGRLLKDGEIVEIDTKMPHQSVQQSKERFNLTFRTIKFEFMPK